LNILRVLGENSEVWLDEFDKFFLKRAIEVPENHDIKKIIRIIEDLNLLFYNEVEVNETGELN